ncbi:MAG TPA: 30S ribosomal protein S6 [Patescibacteria group bacterium]|nr:30S ribosomal protein S6 [Patescibacteria group bacterium]
MNEYEIAIIYDPDLEVDLSKAEDRVKKIITDNDGKVISADNWGKRKLAYQIKRNEHGIYVFYKVELPPNKVHQIESTINITSEVIRSLITKPDLKAMAKAEKIKAHLEEQNAKRKESEEEETDEDEKLNND